MWFYYQGPPLMFSLWERYTKLTSNHLEWKKEKHHQYQIRFPHLPVRMKEELENIISMYEQRTLCMNPFCTSHALHKMYDMMDRTDPDMLCFCSLVVVLSTKTIYHYCPFVYYLHRSTFNFMRIAIRPNVQLCLFIFLTSYIH